MVTRFKKEEIGREHQTVWEQGCLNLLVPKLWQFCRNPGKPVTISVAPLDSLVSFPHCNTAALRVQARASQGLHAKPSGETVG